MDFSNLLLVLAGASVVGFLANSMSDATAGPNLQKKFGDLGVVTGLTLDQVVAVVGSATSVSTLPDNKLLYQWIVPGYHICLIFQDGICEGISSETVINP